ncbi:MAG: HEAT repeat domain-containing protein [Elusimicrobiota bacterium]|mgnify:FL=1
MSIRAALVFLTTGIFYGAWMWSAFFQRVDFSDDIAYWICGHLSASLLLAAAAGRHRAVILTLNLPWPVFGWFICAATTRRLYEHSGNLSALHTDEPQLLTAQARIDTPIRIDDRLKFVTAGSDIMPFADILAGNDNDLKRSAVENLARLKTPEAIKVLLDHRSDTSAETRFYVITAINKIKKEFDEELDAAKRQMRKDVHDDHALWALAKMYKTYADSGLLDAVLADHYHSEAVALSDTLLANAAYATRAWHMSVAITAQRGDWNEVLKRIPDKLPEDPAIAQEALRHRIEARFNVGPLSAMIADLKTLAALPQASTTGAADKSSGAQDPWRSLPDWWTTA